MSEPKIHAAGEGANSGAAAAPITAKADVAAIEMGAGSEKVGEDLTAASRKKRPEVQRYKPRAMTSSSSTHLGEKPSGEKSQAAEVSSKADPAAAGGQNPQRKKDVKVGKKADDEGGGKAGPAENSVTEGLGRMSMVAEEGEEPASRPHGGPSAGGRKKKKPDQSHYVAKKGSNNAQENPSQAAGQTTQLQSQEELQPEQNAKKGSSGPPDRSQKSTSPEKSGRGPSASGNNRRRNSNQRKQQQQQQPQEQQQQQQQQLHVDGRGRSQNTPEDSSGKGDRRGPPPDDDHRQEKKGHNGGGNNGNKKHNGFSVHEGSEGPGGTRQSSSGKHPPGTGGAQHSSGRGKNHGGRPHQHHHPQGKKDQPESSRTFSRKNSSSLRSRSPSPQVQPQPDSEQGRRGHHHRQQQHSFAAGRGAKHVGADSSRSRHGSAEGGGRGDDLQRRGSSAAEDREHGRQQQQQQHQQLKRQRNSSLRHSLSEDTFGSRGGHFQGQQHHPQQAQHDHHRWHPRGNGPDMAVTAQAGPSRNTQKPRHQRPDQPHQGGSNGGRGRSGPDREDPTSADWRLRRSEDKNFNSAAATNNHDGIGGHHLPYHHQGAPISQHSSSSSSSASAGAVALRNNFDTRRSSWSDERPLLTQQPHQQPPLSNSAVSASNNKQYRPLPAGPGSGFVTGSDLSEVPPRFQRNRDQGYYRQQSNDEMSRKSVGGGGAATGPGAFPASTASTAASGPADRSWRSTVGNNEGAASIEAIRINQRHSLNTPPQSPCQALPAAPSQALQHPHHHHHHPEGRPSSSSYHHDRNVRQGQGQQHQGQQQPMVRDWAEHSPINDRRGPGSAPPAPGALAGGGGPQGGGVIRLPPPQQSQMSKSGASFGGNWRNHDNTARSSESSGNPAWRGVSSQEVARRQQLQLQQQSSSGVIVIPQRPPPRYLFDPENPNQPIPVSMMGSGPVGTRMPANNGDHTVGASMPGSVRFPVDPRFGLLTRQPGLGNGGDRVGPMMAAVGPPSQGSDASSHPHLTPPASSSPSSYRPPFPYQHSQPVLHPQQQQHILQQMSVNVRPRMSSSMIAPTSGSSGFVRPMLPPHPNRPVGFMHASASAAPNFDQQDLDKRSHKEEIAYNERILSEMIRKGGGHLLCLLWDKEVATARKTILAAFKKLLQTDLMFCVQNDLEFHIWQVCFYQLVESLKTVMQTSGDSGQVPRIPDGARQPPGQDVETIIVELLDEGMDFYLELLDTLDATYNIGLDKYYDVLEPRSEDKMVRCVLVSAQKCLLCLGDLARYKEQIRGTTNFGKARQFYQRASHIDTRNGRPYNQLAILASASKRKFEAVYYNMRCLSTTSPVISSQESLTLIFEEVRKKWEALEKARLEARLEASNASGGDNRRHPASKGSRLRREIWIRPEGRGRRLHRTTSASGAAVVEPESDPDLKELNGLSTADLNRRFNNTFLYLIGKLYCNINFDTFAAGAELMQKEFQVLVSRSPLPIDSKRLVQIMALNMFVIEKTKMKAAVNDVDQQGFRRSLAQSSALRLAFEMFGVLLDRCNSILHNKLLSAPVSTLPPPSGISGQTPTELNLVLAPVLDDDDLTTLLSAVKVWCDWLLGNNDAWYPIVACGPFNSLAILATQLEKFRPLVRDIASRDIIDHHQFVSISSAASFSGQQDDARRRQQKTFEMIKLDEDALLCGFNSWFRGLSWFTYTRFANKNLPVSLAQGVRRLGAIMDCVDYLEGFEPPILKWSTPDNAHISLVGESISSKSEARAESTKVQLTSKDQDDVVEESYSDEDDLGPDEEPPEKDDDAGNNSKIKELRSMKEELERLRMAQSRILAEELVSVVLEVCPRAIVPDTNCFVDHLTEIKELAQGGVYQVTVPLVVLVELDGLAKGTNRATKYASPEHAMMVCENAKLALAYLRGRPPTVVGVTSKGNLVPSLAVTTEEEGSSDLGPIMRSNDDLILNACVNLSCKREAARRELLNDSISQQQEDNSASGGFRRVYCEVVLLTDDRHLKLKAHTADIPVNKVTDFMKWASKKLDG